jgi:hypothetical protein
LNNHVEFIDRNFRLLVLEKLMYVEKVIQPSFDIYDFSKTYNKREINLELEGYEIIPEALNYLLSIPIQQEWLGRVTALFQDGGSYMWHNIIPHWSGETDDFSINSAVDAKMLPNLKEIVLFYNKANPHLLDEFKSLGIDADWV